MSVYFIVFGTAADNGISSAQNVSYATARSMASPFLGTASATTIGSGISGVGQRFATPNYLCAQGFIGFDTTGVSGAVSATLALAPAANSSTTDFTTEARLHDWGVAVATGDEVAGASLSGKTLLATFDSAGVGALETYHDFTDAAFVANINASGFTRIILCTKNQTDNVTPTTDEYISWRSGDSPSLPPRLTILSSATTWQFVGVSNVVEVTGTSHALVTTGISGLQTGDLLIACISSRIASTTSITLPVGGEWTLVSEQKNNNTATTTSATPSGMMAYCVRGASDPNLTFTHPTSPSVAIGRIVAYRNVDTGSPKDTQTSFTTATNVTAVSGTGLTTTQDDDLIVAMACGGQEATWTAFAAATDPTTSSGTGSSVTSNPAPNAWLERADSNTTTGADTSLGIFDAVKTAAGVTGNLTCTASQGAAHVVVAGAFKLVAVAGGAEKPADHFVDKDFTNSLFVRPRFLLGPRV